MADQSLKYYRWIIACRVRAARKRRNITVHELAKQTAIALPRLVDAENGIESPTVCELERIALALRMPMVHFVGPCSLCGITS